MIPKRENEITRVEAFSDGMIAFAATLLVVNLDPPRSYQELIGNLYGFVPFALSFGALFYIWVVHTTLFRKYALDDKVSIAINGLLLFTVLFYVQPLRFMSSSFVSLFMNTGGPRVNSFEQLQNLFIIYSCGWIVVFLLVAVLYWRAYATRDRLRLTPLEAYDAITWSRHYVGFVLAGIFSILVALIGIGLRFGLAGAAYMSIGLFAWLNARNREPGRALLAQNVADHPQLRDTASISTIGLRESLR